MRQERIDASQMELLEKVVSLFCCRETADYFISA